MRFTNNILSPCRRRLPAGAVFGFLIDIFRFNSYFTGSLGGKIPPGVNLYVDTREANMLEVTDAAYQQIAEFFKDKTVRPIRVLLNPGG